MDAAAITALRAQRAAFLRAAYDACGGTTMGTVHQRELEATLGLDTDAASNLTQYLVDEGLLEYHAMGPVLCITQAGIRAVEAAIAPETPAVPVVVAQNYISVTDSTVGAIQQGTHDSTQVVEQRLDIEALRQLTTELREVLNLLTSTEMATAEEQLAVLDEELASPQPRRPIVRDALRSLQRVVEGAAGSGLAAAAPHLPALAESLARALAALG